MQLRFLLLQICALLILAPGCGKQALPISAETILQPSKGGDFRGFRLGDKPKIIKRQEESSSVFSMPDELIYRFEANEADSTWYEISYSFNEDGLNHISLDVYPQSAALKENLFADFMSYYNQRYGANKTHSSRHEWRGLTVQGHSVTVSLLRDTTGNESNHIRLVFNETNL
jgi:hypothetical protein